MAWTVEFETRAEKQLAKLDRTAANRIAVFLRKLASTHDNPRELGTALKGELRGAYWRYRVGDYRIICDIQDARVVVLVIEIGHRSSVYR